MDTENLSPEIIEILEEQSLPIREMEAVEDMCIQIFDKEGRSICYSKGCEQIEGHRKEDILGKKLGDVYTISKNKENPYGSLPLTVLKTGEVLKNKHVKFTTYDGHPLDVISSTYPVFSKDKSEVIAAICVFRDIGDYIKMANTIQKLEHDLSSTNISKRNNGTIYTFNDIIGESNSIAKSIEKAKKAARNTAPVMIIGSTGTGKEVFAQSIHNASSIASGPFVAINCSAIPENLLESTLFGTCKGAFTGATESIGLFETAKDGTLFLDEINSMSMKLQAKLLRTLETKKIRKVGGNREIPISVRIISATNQDPRDAVKRKQIRADFYYRLAVISLELANLKDRKEDIPSLIDFFIMNHSNVLGKKIMHISDEAKDVLIKHNWPGNIRELKHVIDQSLYLADFNDTQIDTYHLPKYLYDNYSKGKLTSGSPRESGKSLKEIITDMEKQIISDEYRNNGFNVSKTARQLGLTRQNLQYKLKAYDIK
ncbi:arginine utilization regulatory protein [Dethiosulfatibacter aminovorans DSM 17477]|uniref:Arginine utilization regulatory protein n=1 Tax=Dethiosulfatibacter aminovorans DSM 17477 TaxID=1121476 RepID=A0A1M6N5F7_9FIRM|nr:sigma 54-interacting transcriptional regulator [Dethiosulfatibacter aminovorans]SHJ90911.1 arginine utilization regulatory protein [Dethiosulfatibacter aminovorans DSM 17477]